MSEPSPLDQEPRPAVASARASLGPWLGGSGLVLAGLVTFLVLSQHRQDKAASDAAPRAAAAGQTISAPAAPSDFAPVEAAARGQAPQAAPPAQAPPPPIPAPMPLPPQVSAGPAVSLALASTFSTHVNAPAVIVDMSAPPQSASAAGTSAKASATDSAGSPAAGAAGGTPAAGKVEGRGSLSGDEQFADRVSSAEPERVRASRMQNLSTLAPQGAIIPATLETALNSDLPGFARAVVGRDVRGFDGSKVLVPRGSRLVGQYKSAVSQGQSRVFVIWTRIIRPDGVSIQIGSPGGDPLGRAGLDGVVDRHFFEQFTGSVLLSVINAGVASLANRANTEIVIGSAQQATAAAASITTPAVIPPTIKVAQGAPISIFVAKDLDFSTVQGGAK